MIRLGTDSNHVDVSKRAAKYSGVLNSMLMEEDDDDDVNINNNDDDDKHKNDESSSSSKPKESTLIPIPIPNVRFAVLAVVVEFLEQHDATPFFVDKHLRLPITSSEISEYVLEQSFASLVSRHFTSTMVVKEIRKAAHQLEIPFLEQICEAYDAAQLTQKTPDEIASKVFGCLYKPDPFARAEAIQKYPWLVDALGATRDQQTLRIDESME